MRPAHRPPSRRRRGVTLVEMLVAVALLVLMMTILVAVFSSATGAIQAERAYASLDQELRRIDTVIRQDLRGITATMTPAGVDPARDARESRLGYFEYAENSFADAQGEDTDDTLRFTAQAPEGQPFVGRIWVAQTRPNAGPTLRPITVTSQYAEIIYFLRNGNLYRRVLLIAPERQGALGVGNIPNDPNPTANPPVPTRFGFQTDLFQPLSDYPTTALQLSPFGYVIGSFMGLNDISVRPSNYPAGADPTTLLSPSYAPQTNTLADLAHRENRAFNPRFSNDYVSLVNNNPQFLPDGVPDDFNGDGVPDFYPTIYPHALTPAAGLAMAGYVNRGAIDLVLASAPTPYDVLAFPYVFPNSYSSPLPTAPSPYGRIHVHDPVNDPAGLAVNHAPLIQGDSLATPALRPTWWGFPTWRETLSPYWLDPLKRLNDPPTSTYYTANLPGLPTTASSDRPFSQSYGLSLLANAPGNTRWWLSPVVARPLEVPYDPVFTDRFDMPPESVWEDDLLLSNVRSFDVKAYDPNAIVYSTPGDPVPAGYYDLGYAVQKFPGLLGSTGPYDLQTLGHEGRIPPLFEDNRGDSQFPNQRGLAYGNNVAANNVGDNDPNVVRLRRVWDSWSTAYSAANALPMDPSRGPYNGLQAVVPSYPAPYPVPLRGIQIQIRVADPSNQRIKSLTIKQDFTANL